MNNEQLLGVEPPAAVRHEWLYDDRLVACFAGNQRTIVALLDDAVSRNPSGAAVEQGETCWTYADLEGRVEKVASALQAAGTRSGDRIAVFMGNRPEFIALLHAIWRVGAIAVPIGERQSRADVARLVAHSSASLLFHESALQPRVPESLAESASPCLCICLDAPTAGHVEGFEAFLSRGTGACQRQPIDEQAPACLMYTSGTTGQPKGALLSHLGFWHTAENYRRHMRYGAAERFLLTVPGSHISGLVAVVLACLRVAGCLILAREFRAAETLDLIERRRITAAVMVPAMYNLLLLEPDAGRRDLSAWRIGHFGGAPMPAVTIERLADWWPQLELHNGYGATETTSAVTLGLSSSSRADRESVGSALPCIDLRVLDGRGQEVAPGETGELFIRSPGNAIGYWNDAEATRQGFVAGYWRSGDLCSLDGQGRVRLHDRLKDVINRGGFKIHASELEAHLQRHARVIEAAAVARPCPVLGERIHVFVQASGPIALEELRDHCRGELADYKLPDDLTLSDQPLPRNQNGKLAKPVLRAQAAELAARSTSSRTD
ncbi:Acyl-CoA synthetase (AMP-forming)/AMP-acid ligase II [Burkholderiales bacterium 8X]|nr:Acyl-CoA synthetase (AMP-forming)/AMP-acid ligase II [Burkholderiales bacterium 8X]